MDTVIADFRFAARSLLKRPAFSLVALGTLALAIGASTAVFTVVNGVLLKPLPYPEPERILRLRSLYNASETSPMSEPDLADMQSQIDGIEQTVGYSGQSFTLTGFGDAEMIGGASTTGALLTLFGLAPAMGRDFTAKDGLEGNRDVVIVSHAFWTGRLGSDPDVLGHTLKLDSKDLAIIGVAQRGFDFPRGAQLWTPYNYLEEDCGRGCGVWGGLARLAPDADLESVRRQADVVAERLRVEYPRSNATKTFVLKPLAEDMVGDVRAGLLMLLVAVLAVLGVACANVANLLLVRGAGRADELSVRAALGASRGRIVRQLLIESLVLSAAAGLVGLAIARVGTAWLISMAPERLPRLQEVALDATAMSFAVVAATVTAVLSGLVPAWKAARTGLAADLAGAGRRTAGAVDARSRSLLLAAEVALSLMLLLGAGLLLRSFRALDAIDLGFEPQGVLTFTLYLPVGTYEAGHESIAAFEALETRLGALPSVLAVGGAFGSPFGSAYANTRIQMHDRPEPPPGEGASALTRLITPGYLDALGVEVIEGRGLTVNDTFDSTPVALVSREFSRRHYTDGDVLGKQITPGLSFAFNGTPARTIVGIVNDVRSLVLTEDPAPEVYVPQAQFGSNYLTFLVRGAQPQVALAGAVRDTVRELLPDVPLQQVRPLARVVADAQGPARFYLQLLSGFAALAVGLAGVGLYGGVAYVVAHRHHEIAIRMALGARPQGVVAMVLRQGARPMLAGVALGLIGAWAAARLIGSLLYEVSPYDPFGWIAATALVMAIGVAASAVPALRASHISPAKALQRE